MNNRIWLLWFVQERQDSDDTELLLGAYSSEDQVKTAIERLKSQPGFRDYPQGFMFEEYELDKDHWVEGFVRE